MKAYILKENDYYDSDSTTVGITLDKNLAAFWDTLNMCFIEDLEIDSSDMMKDSRIVGEYGMGNGGFKRYLKAMKKRREK
jgi:hypothetical protein